MIEICFNSIRFGKTCHRQVIEDCVSDNTVIFSNKVPNMFKLNSSHNDIKAAIPLLVTSF